MRGLPRRALRNIDTDHILPEGSIPDRRSRDISALTASEPKILLEIEQIFEGTMLPKNPRKVSSILKLRGEVAEAWGHARDAFIEIGRALNAVELELEPAERDAMRRGFVRLFPFSETVATQFRQIARAVDEGRLPLQACPGSYGTAYQLALLTPGQLDIARERGLIRSNVSRNAIISFRKEIQAAEQQTSRSINLFKLQEELDKLAIERRRALDSLVTLRHRMREVRALLAHDRDK